MAEYPLSANGRFQRFRRHKFGFAAAAAILLVLAGGITLTSWQAVRATRAERAQNRARAAEEKARQTAQTEAGRAEASAMEAKRTLSAADFLRGRVITCNGPATLAGATMTVDVRPN